MSKVKSANKIIQKLKSLKKDQIAILFLVGLLLMVITIPFGGSDEQKNSNFYGESVTDDGNVSAADSLDEFAYASELERRLGEILIRMEGVGEVAVMITLESSAEQIVEKDQTEDNDRIEETDSQGGTRETSNQSKGETTIYTSPDSGSQTPYVKKSIMPKVEGVVVIAAGGDNAVVTKNITEVIQALFGIETHKIRIVKMN